MIVEINKDLEKYKESVVLGLTAKQLIFSIASVVVGGGLILLQHIFQFLLSFRLRWVAFTVIRV